MYMGNFIILLYNIFQYIYIDQAGWDLGNIGAKYLALMNIILHEYQLQDDDDSEELLHLLGNYEIISIACHDIIKLIEKKLA